MKNLRITLLFSTLLIVTTFFAQPEGIPITIGESFTIKSEILGEERTYMVHLPNNYNPTGDPVAVMYLMDGESHLHHTSGVTTFLARQGRVPEMMIVAIANNGNRTRDLTPTIEVDEKAKKNFTTAGGADKMLDFMEKELMPHIERNYHTNPYKVLVGHSFGGIFVVNSLLTRPGLFNSYISISPSMWWDSQNLVTKAETFLKTKPALDGFFYMTMGDEGGPMLGGAMKLAALFEELAPEDFGWDFKVMEEETHGSVPHRSTYYGLEAIFEDWYPVNMRKIVQEGKMEALTAYYAKISKKLGYEKKASEMDYNTMGYAFMQQKKYDEALELFDANVKNYPHSFNVYDSKAEAHMKKEEKDLAIKYYKKSLALHPGSAGAVDMLKQLGVDYKPMDQQVKLSEKQLKKIAGAYMFGRNKMTIQMENGGLVIASKNITKQALLSFPNNIFLIKNANLPVRVVMDDNGKVSGIELQTGIAQLVFAEKITP